MEKVSDVLDVNVYDLLQANEISQPENLDDEWLKIVQEAMESGITKEQFREYLAFNKWRNQQEDRKSTRLNSSHVAISYAVFCLKKKKKKKNITTSQKK